MEGAEQSRYVAQLKVEFDSCDTTATGFLDRDELTALCRKLQLDAHLPLLLDTLLGERSYARVNFEEFKDGFVAVLSRSLDFSTSEDDSSYLEPVVPEEVKPKFVKGSKRYGRRSRPDGKTVVSEDSPPSEANESSPSGVRRAKLRRSTSLESVESLKSDEEAGSQKESFQCKGRQDKVEVEMVVGGGGGGEGGRGGGGGDFLTAVCDHLGLPQLNTEDLDSLLRKLDVDLDFQKVLRGSAPISCSTPVRSRTSHQSQSEERLVRSTSPSLLTATVGQRVLSRLDEGSGCTGPDRVIALWTEEGIRNSRDILQTLDFPLEERLSLADLTLALDNELLVSGNGIHQAALVSYKNEIQHLQLLAEQACRERDKVKADLDQADQRNLQLVREVDDRHASMETLNQSRIRDLEQDFRDRLTALRGQSEQDNEALLQQAELERGALQDELRLLRAQGAELQEELGSATRENVRLEEELSAMKLKLTEAECSVSRLQRDLDQLLHDKFGSLDPAGRLSHEERFSEIVKDYELQCRKIKELRDRNDELSSELELLKSQRSDRKSRRSTGSDITGDALSWSQQRPASTESDSDESDMKRGLSPRVRKKLQPVDKMALCSLDGVSGPAVSIQTELALETLKQKHNEELQQLHIQLETQVNYYERSLEVMRQSMEVERKDIAQAFKIEISELEEQKSRAEQQAKQLKETLDKTTEIQRRGRGGALSPEQEHRMQRERAELEQNFAREIGNLVQRLSAEKDQLGAELKLKMDQEVMLVRQEAEQRLRRATQQFSTERRHLEDQVSSLQEALGQSEAALEELSLCCARLEHDLEASHGRRSELETWITESRTREDQLRVQVETWNRDWTTELDSLKTDRARLIQDLKDQAMAVDHLQLALDGLQETLNRDRETRSGLEQEVLRLSQENQSYARLADQLSNQIVEMEEEISTLRDHLRGLSARLNETADLVLELRGTLNAKTGEAERLRDSRDRLEQDLQREKEKMALQLMDLENLVLGLEEAMDPESPRRTQLEEVRLENSALQERLRVLQQEVLNLEDDVAKKRRKLDEAENDHQKSREEAERLHKENSRYREEVLDLSSRNLQLSDDNAELSARLRGDQEAVRTLRERLDAVSKEQEAAARRERETLTQHAVWTQERQLMEREIGTYKDKMLELEAKLSSTTLKLQRLEEEKAKMLRDGEDQNNKVEALQRSLLSVESEAELLRSRLQTVTQHEVSKNQEVTELQRRLLGAQNKVEELESSLRTLMKEQEELRRALKEQEEQKEQQEQEEIHRLRVQNQELQHKLSELQVRGLEVQDLTRDQQGLRTRLSQLETALDQTRDQATRSQDQLTRSQAALGLARVQQDHKLQELQRQALEEHQEQAERLRERLEEEQERSRRLEEALKLQAQQVGSRIGAEHQRHEKTVTALQQRTEQLEVQLKGIRLVLEDKVQQLRDQLLRNSKSSLALQEVFVENSQLMAALQVTERRQKDAEKKNFLLEDRVRALNALLRDVVMATLAT